MQHASAMHFDASIQPLQPQRLQQHDIQNCTCAAADWSRRCHCGRPLICSACKKAYGQKALEVVTKPQSTHCVARAFCPYGPRKGRVMPADVELYYQELQGRTGLSKEWETLLEEVPLWRPPMHTGDEERMRDRGGRTQVLLSCSASIKRYMSVENLDYDEHTADPSTSDASSSTDAAEAEADEEEEEGADEEEEEDLAETNFVYSRLKVKCGSGASCPQTQNLKDALVEAAQSSMAEFERAWEALVTHFTKRGLKDVKALTDLGSIQREAQERKLSVVELLNEIESSSRTTYQSRILRESFICISAFQHVARMLVPKQLSCTPLLFTPSQPLARFPTAMSEPGDLVTVPSNA